MIDSKILKSLTSRENDIAFTLLIVGYEQKTECNSESIEIKMHQVNRRISEIENGLTPIEKTLKIQSALDFDDENNLFITKLIGSSNIKGAIDSIEEANTYNSHEMEMVIANLADEIEISFINPFESIPSINITMDAKTQQLFNDYSCDFESHIENDLYTGVTIKFTKLRKKTVYPEINILIIGDAIANSNGN